MTTFVDVNGYEYSGSLNDAVFCAVTLWTWVRWASDPDSPTYHVAPWYTLETVS